MSLSRVIEVSFNGGSIAYVKADTAYFYNNGILFKPTDIDLPASYQVHWADSPQASSTLETIGTAEGAPIPDDLWDRSRVIYGWIYLHPTNDSGITGYEVRIYKNVRAGLPDGTEPTPAEQSTIDQLISALNTAVEQTGQDAESASQSAQSAENAKTAAESARDTAGEYANDAESSAASASTSASQASASATASAQSASQSAQIKSDIEGMVDDAQGYANSASQSASQASASEQGCARAVLDAASAASIARARADEASGYAQTASTKASEAVGCVKTATQKATEATQSASQALSYKTDAESAKTASQTAQGLAESARDSAVQAKTDAESAKADAESARDEAQQAVASISGALDDKAPIITDTASGAIASFSDGADNLPLKSLVVDINPIQDLHGQDAPYPAGGGKNLYNKDGKDTGNGYENGKYLTSTGSTNSNGAWGISEYIPVSANTQYTLSNVYGYYPSIAYYDTNKTYLSGEAYASATPKTFTTPANTAYVRISVTVATESTVQFEKGNSATSFAPYENLCPISGWTQVNVNHSDADMTNPTTITIDLGQTVYGGKLDVLSGELVIDRAMVDLGTLDWGEYGSTDTVTQYYTTNLDALAKFFSRAISDVGYYSQLVVANTIYITRPSGMAYVRTEKDKYASPAAFKTAMSGHYLVYELATPITYQLTPTEVRSLLGQNHVWADSGDTEAIYRADTKLFIERLTAPDSADMIADANITSGKYFMVGNSLYKATANIANGSAIVVGTNCIRKSLSEALNEINA